MMVIKMVEKKIINICKYCRVQKDGFCEIAGCSIDFDINFDDCDDFESDIPFADIFGWTGDDAKFTEDCLNEGMRVKIYRGYCYRKGPAVFTDEDEWPTVQDVMSATDVKCNFDSCGRDYIVYPA